MRIYLAKPISGRSYEEVVSYYEDTGAELFLLGYIVLCPMTGKSYLRTEKKFKATGYDNPVSTNHAIKERDKWMVGQADVVYVNLVGATEPSIGCISELAWADLLGKHTIVAMEADNPHRHAFILEEADIIFETHAEAMAYLAKLAEGVV